MHREIRYRVVGMRHKKQLLQIEFILYIRKIFVKKHDLNVLINLECTKSKKYTCSVFSALICINLIQ